MKPSTFEYYFNLLYSLYSFPNIVLPFFAGILVTIFWNRIMFIVYEACIVLGQFITSIGSSRLSMNTMLVGRIVFGLGGESLNVCQTSMIVKWFFKSSSALPLGLGITISRLGSVLNDVISPRFAKEGNASPAFWGGLIMCIISFMAITIIFIVDYEKDHAINDGNSDTNIADSDIVKVNCCQLFSDFKHLNTLFWILTFLCLTTYGSVMPFNYIATGFFTATTLKDMPSIEARKMAGIYMGVPFFIGAIMVPIVGALIDKFGNRTILALLSGAMCLITFVFFYLMQPLFPLILLGISYSIFAAVIWPSIAISVNDKEKVGLAYGTTTSIQSLGLAINPLIVASLLVGFGSYQFCLLFFTFLGFISMLFGLWLLYENQYNYNSLLDKVKFDDEEEKKDFKPLPQNPNYNTFSEEKIEDETHLKV